MTAFWIAALEMLEEQFLCFSFLAWGVLVLTLWFESMHQRLAGWLVIAVALQSAPLASEVARLFSEEVVASPSAEHWLIHPAAIALFFEIVWIWTLYVVPRRQWQSLAAERHRIANDLHDGLGSRILALIASETSAPGGSTVLVQALHACLLELQMTVDGLDPQPEATLVERLAHLRYRMQPAFDGSGTVLKWEISPTLPPFPIAHEKASAVCRIVQESLANSLKHSQATCVIVRVASGGADPCLFLEIEDDGIGLQSAFDAPISTHEGKGLRSMRARARTIGAVLLLSPMQPHGLCVSLRIATGDKHCQ